jgi:hypothetical protein
MPCPASEIKICCATPMCFGKRYCRLAIADLFFISMLSLSKDYTALNGTMNCE